MLWTHLVLWPVCFSLVVVPVQLFHQCVGLGHFCKYSSANFIVCGPVMIALQVCICIVAGMLTQCCVFGITVFKLNKDININVFFCKYLPKLLQTYLIRFTLFPALMDYMHDYSGTWKDDVLLLGCLMNKVFLQAWILLINSFPADVKVAVKNKVPLVRSLTLTWVTFCIETSNKAVILKVHKEYVPICMEVS